MLIFKPNAKAVEELESLMRELSKIWCANWMSGVELALWDAVQGNPDWEGQVTRSDEAIVTARRLLKEIQGWVTYPDDWEKPGYISMKDWRECWAGRSADA